MAFDYSDLVRNADTIEEVLLRYLEKSESVREVGLQRLEFSVGQSLSMYDIEFCVKVTTKKYGELGLKRKVPMLQVEYSHDSVVIDAIQQMGFELEAGIAGLKEGVEECFFCGTDPCVHRSQYSGNVSL